MTFDKSYFGWERDGKFYLSALPPVGEKLQPDAAIAAQLTRAGVAPPVVQRRPAVEFDTREDAEAEARRRHRNVKWA